ncbi:MAG: FAD-dependent oxidoreductase, partial [Kineosporiaceae bacterium]
RHGAGVELRTSTGAVGARQVVLATNAARPLLRRLRLMTVPVYDYALMTEPLTTAQRAAIGWHGREGISDRTNRFHYYRTTRDGRILWGGYDAAHHFGGRRPRGVRPAARDLRRPGRALLRDLPAVDAAPGCACSTASASASTPDERALGPRPPDAWALLT